MSVNPVTGIVTYTLAEWKEESQLWERDGTLRERERIIKLLEDRLLMAKDEKYGLTAMRVPVDRASAIAVTEAILWAIKENK